MENQAESSSPDLIVVNEDALTTEIVTNRISYGHYTVFHPEGKVFSAYDGIQKIRQPNGTPLLKWFHCSRCRGVLK